MSRAVRFVIVFGGLAFAGCASAPTSATAQVDGVYVIPEEVSHYQSDRLELKNGRFRYWHSSDSVLVDDHGRPIGPKYPIRGMFRVEGCRVTFSSEDVGERYVDTVNSHAVLWTPGSKRIWERQHKIYDYGVLIRVQSSGSDPESPSVRVLYDAAMLKKHKEWRDPFVHGPQ
jgi:hypothetical protein